MVALQITAQNVAGQDYKRDLYVDVSKLSQERVKQIMLIRLNELRKQKWLKPLQYDKRLETMAQSFAEEKWETMWRLDQNCHFDENWRSPYARAEGFWLLELIDSHKNEKTPNGAAVWLGENMVGTNGDVEEMLSSLSESPWHARWLWSPYVTCVGFGYYSGSTVLVQVFADFKKSKNAKK